MTIEHTPGPIEILFGDGKRILCPSLTAPHECDDPECPGNKNRLKLEAYEEMLVACKAIIARRMESHEVEAAYTPPEIELVYQAIAKAEEAK